MDLTNMQATRIGSRHYAMRLNLLLMFFAAIAFFDSNQSLADETSTATTSAMSVADARHKLLSTLVRADDTGNIVHWENPSVSRSKLEFDVRYNKDDDDFADSDDRHISLRFSSVHSTLHPESSIRCFHKEFQLVDDQGTSISGHWGWGNGDEDTHKDCIVRYDDNFQDDLISTLNIMIDDAKGGAALRRVSIDRATEACAKPTAESELSAQAHSQNVLAKNSVEEKHFDDAFDYYESLEQSEPCFADGQFNAALVAGELGYFEDAVGYMNRYLRLEPNSSDAAAAKDKVIVWQEKIRQQSTSE